MTKIHYIGYDYSHPGSFVYDIPNGHDFWLLILTQTPALIWVNGEIKEYPAHSAVLFQPKQKIYYRANGDSYSNDWIRFDSNETYITATMLPLGVPFSLDDPEYCHKLIQLLASEHYFDRAYKETSIDCLFRTLFNKLLEAFRSDYISPQYYNLIKLRTEIYSNPGNHWSVPKMAELLHISPGYLQTIYKNTFGISCMEDVIDSRIRLAREYLFQDSHSISEVAALCGYHNVEHFCRQFKQVTGHTPGALRTGSLKHLD